MGRFGRVQWAGIVITIFLFFCCQPAAAHKPPGANPFPAKITLNPATSASMQLGSTSGFHRQRAERHQREHLARLHLFLTPDSPAESSPSLPAASLAPEPGTPRTTTFAPPPALGTVKSRHSAGCKPAHPPLVFVHPAIDNIQISVVPPVNSPPPACPTQTALPLACKIPFNATPPTIASRKTRQQTLQATAYSQGVDITASVGPFTWTQANANVVTITPIVTSSANVATNQATVVPNTPGQTQVIASASGVSSQPYIAETCPVQCIALQLTQRLQTSARPTSSPTKAHRRPSLPRRSTSRAASCPSPR